MLLWDGGDSRDRTGDLLLARQALSQLSYIPQLSLLPLSQRIPSKLNNVTTHPAQRLTRMLRKDVSLSEVSLERR